MIKFDLSILYDILYCKCCGNQSYGSSFLFLFSSYQVMFCPDEQSNPMLLRLFYFLKILILDTSITKILEKNLKHTHVECIPVFDFLRLRNTECKKTGGLAYTNFPNFAWFKEGVKVDIVFKILYFFIYIILKYLYCIYIIFILY